jgi:hypothetical protein
MEAWRALKNLVCLPVLAKIVVQSWAQLIAAKQAERSKASDCWIIKNIQPISVGV